MINQEIELYKKFLEIIMKQINAHFENQKEYIHCKEGCSLCCSNGEYPCSEIEIKYLLTGFSKLPKEIQTKITNNIKQIKTDNSPQYICPFLINNKCSVYEYRMVVCRTFGLLYCDETQNSTSVKIPFCYQKGLNYSEVYDEKTKNLSQKKCENLGYKNKPIAYNLDSNNLKKKFGEEVMNIDFGEEKALITWL